MRKDPKVYDITVKYILSTTQRHMSGVLYNPIYSEKIPKNLKKLKFYKFNLETRKVKKTYKTATGFKYLPKEINIQSEDEKVREMKKKLIKKNEKKIVKKKEQKIVLPKMANDEIKESKSEVKEVKKEEEEPKKKFVFEVLKEEKNFDDMVKKEISE